DGNSSQIIVWIADTTIVKKPLDKKTYYYIADAVTGTPIAKANVEFFGWRQQHVKNNTYRIDTLNFAEFTDVDGQVMPDAKRQPIDYQWVAIARTTQGRLAYLGFSGVWQGNYYDDEYGGFEGEMELPTDAVLGVYQLTIPTLGGGSFRVEEYKKPEFEVKVEAPTEPVMLGEKITASVEAKYYFGSPVTEAKVKYKIYRTGYDQRWYPIATWDWFYGRGYGWFAYDYVWYP